MKMKKKSRKLTKKMSQHELTCEIHDQDHEIGITPYNYLFERN
jgi:hypothetical protein